MRRHPTNSNLHLHTDEYFHGVRVYLQRGPLVQEYLERSEQAILAALADYARVFAFRTELHLPSWYRHQDGHHPNAVIERFLASLRAKIGHNRAQASRERSSVHQTTVRFIWVREFGFAGKPHYHLLVLMNGNAFNSLGDFKLGLDNMYNRVVEAWASALHGACEEIASLVTFPDSPMYWLNRGDHSRYADLFYRVSYMSKADTKQYPDRGHAFGYSRH